MEVGGSSLQLTFPTDEDPAAVPHVHAVEINGRKFAVSCRSFLGLGQDDARKEMRSRLGPEGSAVCFPGGFLAAVDHGDVVDGVGTHRLAEAGVPGLRHARGDFVGIDGVYYATEYWDIDEDPERLADAIRGHCGTVTNFPGIDAQEFVQMQAANATYVHGLMRRLFAGTGRRLIRAVPSRRDGDTMPTWTRGYLLARHSRPRGELSGGQTIPRQRG